MSKRKPEPMLCPHCRKAIRQSPKPRDLGLLLHILTYRVPVEQEISDAWIEVARKHCKMKPERLADLQAEPFRRFWGYMEDKRARRLEWLHAKGEVPPYGWTPPRAGESDGTGAVIALRTYRHTVARLKSRLRKNPEGQTQEILNRYRATRRFRNKSSKMEALHDIEARLVMQWAVEKGDLTMKEYRHLDALTLPDDRYSSKSKRRKKS